MAIREGVGRRLREARELLGATQKDLGARIGMPVPSLRDYELGKTIPGGEAIEGFIRAGINANWLLTGEGEMLLKDSMPAGALDRKRLFDAIDAIEIVLKERGTTMPPDKKANLILAAYDFLGNDDATTEQLENVIRFAA